MAVGRCIVFINKVVHDWVSEFFLYIIIVLGREGLVVIRFPVLVHRGYGYG